MAKQTSDPAQTPIPIATAGIPGPRLDPADLTGNRAHRSEAQRLADLYDLDILDTEPEQVFDDLVAIASRIAGVPTSLVSLVDDDRQWFKAKVGFDACSSGRDVAFCDHVVRAEAEMEVPDARLDPRFAENPLVTGDPHIVFYAGFPLFTATGSVPGTLCVIGYEPHRLDEEQKTLLRALARQVVVQLELRFSNAEQAREIELRKAAETELARSRRNFQLLAENSTDVVTRFEADGTIAYVSPAVENVLGFPATSAEGHQPAEFLHPGDQAEFDAAFQDALAGQTRTITVRAGHQDGTYPWLEMSLSGVVRGNGVPEVITNARDVTGRVNATSELAMSEQRFRSVHHGSPVGIALHNEVGQIIEVNPALCRLLKRPEHELLGQPGTVFVVPDPEPEILVRYRELSEIGDTLQIERRVQCGDGEIRWVLISMARVAGPEGQLWMLAHIQDIDDRKAAEQALADSEANLAAIRRVVRRIQTGEDPRETIVNAARDVAQTDSASLIEPAPDDAESLIVTSSSTTAGHSYNGTVIPLGPPSVTAHVWRTGETVFIPDASADPRINAAMLAQVAARSLLWQPIIAHGKVTAILSVSWDRQVSDLAERAAEAVMLLADEAAVALEHDALMKQYQQLATTDQLTGLPNRRSWDERLAVLVALAERSGEPLVIALADVDHFKAYNDSRGHLEGDILLRETGEAIREQLRAVDIVARWGGEEFAIALPNCGIEDALVVLDRVRTATPREQTVSVGFALWTPDTTIDAAVGAADQALYQAKRAGRNRIAAATN